MLAFGLQGGGIAIYGTATLTNTNVYSNTAIFVCSPSALAQTNPPSPQWNADFCYVRFVAVCELSCELNPCVTFHRPTGLLTVAICVCVAGGELSHESNPHV